MTYRRLFTLFVMVIASMLALTTTVFSQEDAGVRFIYTVSGGSAADIYVNSQLAVANLSYGEASAYLDVPAGALNITVNTVDTSSTIFSQTITVEAGSSTTLITSSPGTPQFDVVVDDRRELAFGNTRFSIVHGIEGGSTVDVVFLADGTVIAEGLSYGASFGTFDVPANVYELAVVPTGGDVSASIADLSLPLSASTTNVVVIYGTPDAPQVLIAAAPTAPNNDSGLVRFAHAILGATPVDVIVDGSMIIPSLSFESPSEHVTLPVGSHEVSLSINDTEIASLTLDVTAGTVQTVVALGSPSDLSVSVFSDDLSGLTADSALVSVINAIPDSTIANITLANGTSIAADLAFNSASSSSNIDAGSQSFSVELAVGDDSGTVEIPASMFYNGSYYNIIALPGNAFTGPQLLAAETSILRGLGDASEVASSEPATNTSSEVAVATPAPVIISADGVFTARINLNPDANLQLRQYPSSEALSLGLAPSGSVLTVIGRRGPSEYFEGEPADEPVDMSDFGDEDPAAALEDEDDDLAPEDTWLFVTFSTPDGGAINAWVNAQYLIVVDDEGVTARLADIDLIRQNESGEAIATAITPPSEPIDRVSVVVYNLDPGVQLNLRRTKGTDGEVIARVEVGTVMSFLGIDEDQEWAFVEYLSPDGGAITGWVSFQYVQVQLNGELSDLEEIEDDDETLVVIMDNDERGEIRGNAERPSLPTPDPLEDAVVGEVYLDAGASLQLRRTPNVEGESLDLVPSGTRLIITGITRNEEWYKVTFEDVEGWVSSQYLVLSFNGEFIEIDEIDDELETFRNNGESRSS
jgi:uncharacterized protein YgiM (DUF1202 family)